MISPTPYTLFTALCKALRFVVPAFLALLSWEILLEATVFRSPGFYKHPILGGINRSGYLLSGQEGFSVTFINSLGMRNRELTPKPAGTFRILVLGDSYTEAVQVGNNETYCSRLESLLSSGSMPIEVVNAGRSGASPAYYLYLSSFYRQAVQPDLTVVQLNEQDFSDGLLNRETYFYVKSGKNGFVLVDNTSRVDAYPFTQQVPWLREVTRRSSVLHLVHEKLKLMSQRPETWVESKAMASKSIEPSDALITWTLRSLRNRYGRLVVVYSPLVDYQNLNRPTSRIEQLIQKDARAEHIPFLDLHADYVDFYRAYRQPVHGFNNTAPGIGHLNEKGHELVARRLASYIKMAIEK